jgi:dienelactone hydrolase
LDAHAAFLLPHASVVRPEGEGSFPVVVQMHGCGGIRRMQQRYAETARQAGFAAVIVDSLGPRRIGRKAAQLTVCTGLRLRGAERARDLLAILHWLKSQPWADTGRLAAAGWSHGGWSIMEAMCGAGRLPAAAGLLEGVKVVVLYYPYAGPPAQTCRVGWGAQRPQVFAYIGGRDAVVGEAAPRRALDRLGRDGLAVQVLRMGDATHCFDDDEADDPRSVYRADLEAQAQHFYATALAAARGA